MEGPDRLQLETGLLRYWGKAAAGAGPAQWHPLVFHSLDVAAVAAVYLERQPRLLCRLALWLGLDADTASRLLTAVIALHDLGKFAENFQDKCPHIFRAQFSDHAMRLRGSSERHDSVGAKLIHTPNFQREMRDLLSASDDALNSVSGLLLASIGHHGMPVRPVGNVDFTMSQTAQTDAVAFTKSVFEILAVPRNAMSFLAKDSSIQLASWWVAGLAVLADWVGSNTDPDWFPYAIGDERSYSLPSYWEQCARPRAARALRHAGVLPVSSASWQGASALFPELARTGLRPAQALVADVVLSDEPQLFLLEDATGSGKTEAALVLAHRLMATGLADGVFFGLPTQATADQMYGRIDNVGPRLFVPDAQVSIVLAHGSREQNALFRSKRLETSDASDASDTASTQLSQWLGQGSKRALLGQLGVGTLDQAQLAALRVKHQPLRLLGLFGKVLIVDEVHAYDAYMQGVLQNLLSAHAAAGGPAILLSATLPLSARQALFKAYDLGARWLQPVTPKAFGAQQPLHRARPPESVAYPLLTSYSVGDTMCVETGFDSSFDTRRTVRIDYRHNATDVHGLLAQTQVEGRCGVWIRNSVREAVEAYEQLRGHLDPSRLILFHSRFALCDRLDIQTQLLERFDRHSTAARRRGCIVIATQVIEQSLDVDFDVMVSDLAPIDALLQRQGRLRRHRRDAEGNPVETVDQRGDVVFTVFGPDRDVPPDAAAIRRFSSATDKIYPAHGRLWLSACELGDVLHLPQDFRNKIEAVYGDTAEPPACFEDADSKAWGEHNVARLVASRNAVDWQQGYVALSDWQDDERIGTRLGVTIEAVLACWDGAALQPHAPMGNDDTSGDCWARSAIRIPGHWPLDSASEPIDEHLAQAVRQLRANWPALKWRLVIPLISGNASLCNSAGRRVNLSYEATTGLSMN